MARCPHSSSVYHEICREANWPLHKHTVQMMLPYFAAAGHWHYMRSTVVHLIKMTKLPKDLLQKIIKGEHAIWSDMMIETTVMRYGHGPAGMRGITLNENALNRWARSLHISSVLEQSLVGLKETSSTKDVLCHKEESHLRIKSDSKDRKQLRKYLATCINPLSVEDHRNEIVNMHSGKLSTDQINEDSCVLVGKKQVKSFISALPDSFYNPLTMSVKTMNKLKKSISMNDIEVIDTSLIYSRAIALQLTNNAMKVENVFKYELSPIPTSIFEDTGNLRPAKSR